MTDRTPGTDSGGTTPYNNPASPDERLAEVLRDRKLLATATPIRKGPPTPRADRGWISGAPETSSYFQEAGLDDDEVGGRYAPRRGNDPVAYPAQPPNSPWSHDPVGIEPPIGERVDSIPDMITLSGEDHRGLTPWQFGPWPTEEHSAYQPLEPSASGEPNSAEASASGCPSSGVYPLSPESPETATQISVAGAVSGLPPITAHLPSPQPLEPNDVPPTEET
jgi:hypothetical protein